DGKTDLFVKGHGTYRALYLANVSGNGFSRVFMGNEDGVGGTDSEAFFTTTESKILYPWDYNIYDTEELTSQLANNKTHSSQNFKENPNLQIDLSLAKTPGSFYPNPFQDHLNIPTNNSGKLVIINMLGQIVYQCENCKTTIDLRHLKTGLYQALLIDNSGKIILNAKIMKISGSN
ncbi:T9SS type A sorting domain-containing protein, partial [Xanthovirga aplysinae]|uniref:T9SS type A sorting domain-containing protein n=1 Tax=Xanthovirga aplysinae TaxID=2529853 RepID=UPI0012BD46B8